ncbi:hypothetical protein CC86DRAFT_410127 [Ophiobolus disseminans]|uniref:Uncharacterized protein n=1 Tax=Ophiobolus disseminans TaxID=1469910 RepID=A0A6A6ZNU0_9PLEO|nr:hypothetical protein CC86DRAFT_410127 [Ophiobolus disseminans]
MASQTGSENDPTNGNTPKQRGRPVKTPPKLPLGTNSSKKRKATDTDGVEDNAPEKMEEVEDSAPRKRGRPPTYRKLMPETNASDEVEDSAPKKRGRPMKYREVLPETNASEEGEDSAPKERDEVEDSAPKKRGQPVKAKKVLLESNASNERKSTNTDAVEDTTEGSAPKKRGWPPKLLKLLLETEASEKGKSADAVEVDDTIVSTTPKKIGRPRIQKALPEIDRDASEKSESADAAGFVNLASKRLLPINTSKKRKFSDTAGAEGPALKRKSTDTAGVERPASKRTETKSSKKRKSTHIAGAEGPASKRAKTKNLADTTNTDPRRISVTKSAVLHLWSACIAHTLYPELPWYTCFRAGATIPTKYAKLPRTGTLTFFAKNKTTTLKTGEEVMRVMKFILVLDAQALKSFKHYKMESKQLKKRFGGQYAEAKSVFLELLQDCPEDEINNKGLGWYEAFKPEGGSGLLESEQKKGYWKVTRTTKKYYKYEAKGTLDLELVEAVVSGISLVVRYKHLAKRNEGNRNKKEHG